MGNEARIMELEIDRAKWRTGSRVMDNDFASGTGSTALLNNGGYMCCLGFFALACGYEEDDIRGYGDPSDMEYVKDEASQTIDSRWPDWFLTVELDSYGDEVFSHDLSAEFINTNDDAHLTHAEREEQIAAKFAKHGIKVKFVGEYPDVDGGLRY